MCRAQELNRAGHSLIERSRADRQAAHLAVNQALLSKIAATQKLQRELNAARGETRSALNSTRRFRHMTDQSFHTLMVCLAIRILTVPVTVTIL